MDDVRSTVVRAQEGDAAAYETLVARFQDMAYGYAYALLGDFQMAQDAAQEAFIEAYRCLPALREPIAFPSWFKRIVFKWCDRLTRGQRAVPMPAEALDRRPAGVPGPAQTAEARDLRASVLEAVRHLPDREREVTALYYIDGYSQQEIAAFLGIPTTTVKNRLYTARKRLKERMLDMIRDTLGSNALPESFTEETLARAVAQAAAWNEESAYAQAEALLRDVLSKAPGHPAALKELNRALMRGRIYSGRGEWELLPELAAHGRDVLAAGAGNAHVRREMAETLLAIPAMEEAAAYLQEWIAAEGPDVERLGMLAWAQACRGHYAEAEMVWAQALDLAREADSQKVEEPLAHACEALVDALASAGEGERAAQVAREGWTVARRGPVSSPSRWMAVAYQAGMDLAPVAQTLLGCMEAEEGLEVEVEALTIRAWIDDPEEIIAAAREWARACLAAGRVPLIGRLREVGNVFRPRHGPHARTRLAQAMWELLADHPDARTPWGWDRFDVFAYLHAGLLDEAAALARQHYEEAGLPAAGNDLIVAAAALGELAPPEVVQALKAGGIEAVDEYGLFGWYLRARVALAEGRVEEALEALRTSLDYWSNPPLGPFADLWEQDRAWDPLRGDPRYQQIWADKRARIGPIHGNLHYFPGW